MKLLLAPLFCVGQRPSWPNFLVSPIEKTQFKGGKITPSVLLRALWLGLTLLHAALPQRAGHPNATGVNYFSIIGTRCLLKAVLAGRICFGSMLRGHSILWWGAEGNVLGAAEPVLAVVAEADKQRARMSWALAPAH